MHRVCALFLLVAVAILPSALAGFYEGSDVIEITPQNFKDEVLNSDSVVIMEFYAVSDLAFTL